MEVGNAWITTPEMVENVEREFGPGQPNLSSSENFRNIAARKQTEGEDFTGFFDIK